MQGPRSVNAETGSAIPQAACLRPKFRNGTVQLQSRYNLLVLHFHQRLEMFFSCWVNTQEPAESPSLAAQSSVAGFASSRFNRV